MKPCVISSATKPAARRVNTRTQGRQGSLQAQVACWRRRWTRRTLQLAWKRIKANKGAAGVDGLDIEQTAQVIRQRWPDIRQMLLQGRYRPSPVRKVMIPKPDGSQRELGIPTVLDRLIQQALLQVLQPMIDPTFSEHSHGFRPGRRAHDAVQGPRLRPIGPPWWWMWTWRSSLTA